MINITGPAVLRVRDIALEFARQFECDIEFEGNEASTAWLSNASRSHQLLGPPAMTLDKMIESIADWLRRGGQTLNKPTHFETRDGAY